MWLYVSHDRPTRIIVLVDSQRSTSVLDEEVQNADATPGQARLDRLDHLRGDEVTALFPAAEGAVGSLLCKMQSILEPVRTNKVCCQGMLLMVFKVWKWSVEDVKVTSR